MVYLDSAGSSSAAVGCCDIAKDLHDWKWCLMLQLYVDYKAEFGMEPAHKAVFGGKNIGSWCAAQKRMLQEGRLSGARADKLEKAGFDLSPYVSKRQHMLNLYVAYKKEFGMEPAAKVVYMGAPLGRWCVTQRHLFNAGTLREEQVQQLRDVGFVFDKRVFDWERKFALYVAYKKEFGQEPGRAVVVDGVRLGFWCDKQRDVFARGQLSAERVQRLQEVDFVFDVQAFEWEYKLGLYVAYKHEFGQEPLQHSVFEGVQLGRWCDTQRERWKKGKVSQERVEKLLAVGFPFHYSEHLWQQKVALYCDYKQEFGKEPDRDCVYRGERLGDWCQAQRQAFKQGRLSEERIAKLEGAGFPFCLRVASSAERKG